MKVQGRRRKVQQITENGANLVGNSLETRIPPTRQGQTCNHLVKRFYLHVLEIILYRGNGFQTSINHLTDKKDAHLNSLCLNEEIYNGLLGHQ